MLELFGGIPQAYVGPYQTSLIKVFANVVTQVTLDQSQQ